MGVIPSINRATATDAEKLAWVKARVAAEPWDTAMASVIQDMRLVGIPQEMAAELGVAVSRG